MASMTVVTEIVSLTVLVIDGSGPSSMLLRNAPKHTEYQVLEAPDWRAGLDVFAQQRPACVLLDFDRTNAAGLAFCRSIRALPEAIDSTILLLISERSVQLFDAALLAGIDEVLLKPLPEAELLAHVQATLSPNRYARSELQRRCDWLRQQRANLETEG